MRIGFPYRNGQSPLLRGCGGWPPGLSAPAFSIQTKSKLLQAPVPTACEHPARRLVNGELPGVPEGQGGVGLDRRNVVLGRLMPGGGRGAAAGLLCNRGGVSWPLPRVRISSTQSVRHPSMALSSSSSASAGSSVRYTSRTDSIGRQHCIYHPALRANTCSLGSGRGRAEDAKTGGGETVDDAGGQFGRPGSPSSGKSRESR